MEIRGVQGEVDKVYEAGKFTLAFAGLRLDSPSMTSIDTTKNSHDDGVDISGFIGAPALTQFERVAIGADTLSLYRRP